jgi:ABC-type transporter Mla subunit MlaD
MNQEKKDKIKKQARDLLDTLGKEGLFRPRPDLDKELANINKLDTLRKEQHEILDEILKHYKQGILPLNRDKLNVFFLFYVLDNFVFNVEFDLKILKAILDPTKITGKFNPRTPYGFLIDRIANTLNLSEPRKKELKELMYVELRNSISHLDYEIDHHSFSYKKTNNETVTYTIERLPELMFEYNALSEAFNEFLGKHTIKKD